MRHEVRKWFDPGPPLFYDEVASSGCGIPDAFDKDPDVPGEMRTNKRSETTAYQRSRMTVRLRRAGVLATSL